MLPEPKILTINLDQIFLQGEGNDGLHGKSINFEEVTTFLETMLDTALKAVSTKARNDFIIKKYHKNNEGFLVTLKANESIILSYLDSKSFDFEQYDRPIVNKKFSSLFNIFGRSKQKERLNKKDLLEINSNKSLVVRTLSNLFIEQIEMIVSTQIKMMIGNRTNEISQNYKGLPFDFV